MKFTLPSLPSELRWKNEPADWHLGEADGLVISAAAETDWFHDPAGTQRKRTSPVALFTPPDEAFTLSARVSVGFADTFDAGVLHLYLSDDVWAKLCFEYSPQCQPTIVSVVTRGTSDDCNSEPIETEGIYLRVAGTRGAFSFHFSEDGRYWRLVRHFGLEAVGPLAIGFSSQSPLGSSCTTTFSDITFASSYVTDIRSGE